MKAALIAGGFVTILLGLLGLSLLLAWPLEIAWNYVMPYLFGFKTLGLVQAWALTFVASSLLKSGSVSTKG